MMRVCVIIPAYNEERTIQNLIKEVKVYVPDILVMDDGSTDKTAQLARESGAVVISFKNNIGKGKVLRDGFIYALKKNYDAVITVDADGQHSAGDILNIIDGASSTNVGIVVGNRMANPTNMPLLRFLTNLSMSFLISSLSKQNIPDTQCGFRLIKNNVLRKIRLVSSNYEIESEILIRAGRLGFKIVSVPIKVVYEGQISLIHPILDTWRFLVMLFRAMF